MTHWLIDSLAESLTRLLNHTLTRRLNHWLTYSRTDPLPSSFLHPSLTHSWTWPWFAASNKSNVTNHLLLPTSSLPPSLMVMILICCFENYLFYSSIIANAETSTIVTLKRNREVNTMVANALVTCVTLSSATMVLIMQNKRVYYDWISNNFQRFCIENQLKHHTVSQRKTAKARLCSDNVIYSIR